jgi:hypothetical protein
MMEDGSVVCGSDDERSAERAPLYYLPGRGAGLSITDGSRERIVIEMDQRGVPAGPRLKVFDETGRKVFNPLLPDRKMPSLKGMPSGTHLSKAVAVRQAPMSSSPPKETPASVSDRRRQPRQHLLQMV